MLVFCDRGVSFTGTQTLCASAFSRSFSSHVCPACQRLEQQVRTLEAEKRQTALDHCEETERFQKERVRALGV